MVKGLGRITDKKLWEMVQVLYLPAQLAEREQVISKYLRQKQKNKRGRNIMTETEYPYETKCKKCGEIIYIHLSKAGKPYPCNSEVRNDFHNCKSNNKRAPEGTPGTIKTNGDGDICNKCGQVIYWKYSQKAQKSYPVDDPNDHTSFHSKTCGQTPPANSPSSTTRAPTPDASLKSRDAEHLEKKMCQMEGFSWNGMTVGDVIEGCKWLQHAIDRDIKPDNQPAQVIVFLKRLGTGLDILVQTKRSKSKENQK